MDPSPFDDGALYDVICAGLDYGVEFYLSLAKAAAGPVLEVACGTGRITLPCLQAGVDIDGLDLSAAMLDRLREKAEAVGYRPTLYQASMSAFELPRRYALVMITFNAFVHNLSTDEQLGTLRCCREHLLPGGLLAFDAYFPGREMMATDQMRVLEGELKHPETGLPIRCYDNRTFDPVEQIQHSLNEIEFLDASGAVAVTHRSRSTARWIYKQEMELLMRLSGFSRWEICGDFDRRPLVKETDGMVVLAWK